MIENTEKFETRQNHAHGGGADIEITLGLLNAVGENSAVTQRSIARELDIALGLANAYLKRCVRKGLIKVNQVPRNRYAYYLTPRGFAEKSRLTSTYLSMSFNFFRVARRQCSDVFAICREKGWERVALAGCSDVAEIATLCAREHNIKIVGIVDGGPLSDNETERREYVGLPVATSLTGLGNKAKAVLVTDTDKPQEIFDQLGKSVPTDRILTIALLNISREKPKFGDE